MPGKAYSPAMALNPITAAPSQTFQAFSLRTCGVRRPAHVPTQLEALAAVQDMAPPNPSIEATPCQLRCQGAPHVERYASLTASYATSESGTFGTVRGRALCRSQLTHAKAAMMKQPIPALAAALAAWLGRRRPFGLRRGSASSLPVRCSPSRFVVGATHNSSIEATSCQLRCQAAPHVER